MADIDERELVTSFFQKAYEDQVEINLIFLMDMCQFASLRAPCVMIKNKHFVVRVPLEKLKEQQIIWGADVNGYFTVRTDDRRTIHFKSKLVRIYNAPPDSMFLIFPIPRQVDYEQKRHSRRVDIDRDTAHGFGVWYGSMEGGDTTTLPQQVWRPFENEDCELGELSASGMRLDFDSNNQLVSQLSLDTPVLLKGDFGTPAKPMPIFILGVVIRKMPRRDKEGLTSLGCHFYSWRKVEGQDVRWFKADPQEGIASVSQWLSRNFRGSSSLAHKDKKQ